MQNSIWCTVVTDEQGVKKQGRETRETSRIYEGQSTMKRTTRLTYICKKYASYIYKLDFMDAFSCVVCELYMSVRVLKMKFSRTSPVLSVA